MKKLISIIIPVYNSEKYFSDCIESVLAQTYSNIEIIIVDDGSTDGTLKLCKQYAKKNKNIKLYRQKNSGAGVARLFGVKKSTGAYIIFLDSDDYLERTAIETISSVFQKTKADIIRFHACYSSGGKILEKIKTNGEILSLSHNDVISVLVFTDRLSSMCFQAYGRTCFDGVKSTGKITYCEDYLINQKIHEKNFKVVVMGDVLYHYRINVESTTKTTDLGRLRKNIDERIYACSETVKFIEKNITDVKTKEMAKAYQIERIRPDILKLLSRYKSKEDLTSMFNDIFNSRLYNDLIGCISSNSINLYLKKVNFLKRFRTRLAVEAFYNRDVYKSIKAVKLYKSYSTLRMIKMGGRKWM
ncbi:MAG: glycosyltransferase family A protein [Candidatus Saccharibacteria bacterium]|nr:glycosyltransferase family A protein [Candidatus Saccharibacteria bacterium]